MNLLERLAQRLYDLRVYRKYVAAIRADAPPWSGRLEGDEGRALELLDALLTRWPGAVVSYNLWWVAGTARAEGLILLDGEEPILRSGAVVDEGARNRREILAAGGPGALVAFDELSEEEG